jgi:hypothetical protein
LPELFEMSTLLCFRPVTEKFHSHNEYPVLPDALGLIFVSLL